MAQSRNTGGEHDQGIVENRRARGRSRNPHYARPRFAENVSVARNSFTIPRQFALSQCCSFRELSTPVPSAAQGEASFRRFISKDERDAYHLDAPPNDFANPMLPAFGKRQFETIRDNGVNHDLRAMF
jgi:hypothetical protein